MKAEQVADEDRENAAAGKQLQALRRQHESFQSHLKAALEQWRAMGPDGRLDLAWHAHANGAKVAEWDGSSTSYLKPIVSRFDANMREIQRAATAAIDVQLKRGPKPGVSQSSARRTKLEPLRAFSAVLKDFFENETGLAFGQEFETRDDSHHRKAPKSAGAKLVCEAVKWLDQNYTTANIETVLRQLQRTSAKKGGFRKK